MTSRRLLIVFLFTLLILVGCNNETEVKESKEMEEPTTTVKGIEDFNFIVEPKYEDAWPFSEGLARVKLDGLWGFVDEDGKEEIEPKYEHASRFSEGYSSIRLDGESGYIDKTGEYLKEPKFDRALSFNDGIALVELDGKQGIIDEKGNYVIEPVFDSLKPTIANNLIVASPHEKDGNYYGYINKEGEYIIDPNYSRAKNFSKGLAAVECKDTDLWGFIDEKGEYVIEPKFNNARSFTGQEELAAVSIEDYIEVERELNDDKTEVKEHVELWGFIDKSGEYAIEPQFKTANEFRDGMASVTNFEGKIGYINQKGDYIIEPQYTGADIFKDGINRVQKDGKDGFINEEGEYIIEPNYLSAWPYEGEGFVSVDTGEQQTIYNLDGEIEFKVDPDIDWLGHISKETAVIIIDGEYGYVEIENN
ncbi:WG repeat-containing protein [Natranaerobius thermophilus]|uniref:KWG Leptospira repeat protein n=1 Tax=Natranaerobius thermophilus (strain ATCC BAA-1301 / DSM 18059 / JW/NM-WN-LF) TaxID=457570 RepID=B2A424_NATTJ|nr:WG repeat-containing protein [Natranaerobius thermophilus]ACB85126.1 KWG Leptospira repeat protein [Natranaerobius thermophilus JW/NM-WN-LF]